LGQIKHQYGYEQFPQETNETAALDKLLTDASKMGTLYQIETRILVVCIKCTSLG
jgi:hypothetical protein